MRTSDATYYNLRRMHVLFAVSSLALLGATVWMLAADHWRPWRVYQRTYRQEIEPWITQSQLVQARTEANSSEAARLERILAEQRPNRAKQVLGWPILDAFGRTLAVDQIWLPELTINYNFRQVARFDRCTTCHQAIDRPSPESPAKGALPKSTALSVSLPAPAAGKKSLADAYRFTLAEQGLLDPQTVCVEYVAPRSVAAKALLEPGDRITAIDGKPVRAASEVESLLLASYETKGPVKLDIARGLPHPYASHPRLDLFVGTKSPHPKTTFGCTACHDGQGSATDFTWASHAPNDPSQRAQWRKQHGWSANPHWDYPMLPRRLGESLCLKCHVEVSDLEPSRRFPDPPAPRLTAGYDLVRRLGCFGCHEINGYDNTGRRVGPDMRLETATASPSGSLPPGTMRKVGLTLAELRAQTSPEYVYHWLADPTQVRPTTRMPRLFGLHAHLDGPAQTDAARLEAVEMRAIVAYLMAASKPEPIVDPPSGATEPASAERGKQFFQTQGCLGCHAHADFPAGQSIQGPNLTGIGTKYVGESGRQWLQSWIRDPARHAPRAKMPSVPLGLVTLPDENPASKEPRTADPMADIAAWLLQSAGPQPPAIPPFDEKALDELVTTYLAQAFPAAEAAAYAKSGTPGGTTGSSGGTPTPQDDQALFLAPRTTDKKLQYVGRFTVRKRGCVGCHDVPSLNDAPAIGPSLTGWGRKQTSLLLFGQVDKLLERQDDAASDERQGFFRQAVLEQRREGFAWQKLTAPRSFDYQTTGGKAFGEQLRMGQFSLTPDQREAITTFLLGLVAEPPSDRYLPQFDVRRKAIVEGRKAIDTLGCAECHTLGMERWRIEYDPTTVAKPAPRIEYDSAKQQLAPAELAVSRRTDRRGLAHGELVGMPRIDTRGKLEEGEDDDGNPTWYFGLWEAAAIGGNTWPVGGADVVVSKSQLIDKRPPWGGALARLLFPIVVSQAKASGASSAHAEAWGWLPPPLTDVGRRVQPAWLHEYLLAPRVIRPAAVLRMPKFNLSADEARKLADYFAATSGVEFPYVSSLAGRANADTPADPKRLAQAEAVRRLVLDKKTYCAKCHLIGDTGPGGENKTVLAPNLEEVGRRIRPEFLRRWLADPKSLVPYTAMPVNFPPSGEPLGQDLLPGSSREQLDAVVDFLLNYDWYLRRK